MPTFLLCRFAWAPCAAAVALAACSTVPIKEGEHQFTPAEHQQAELLTQDVPIGSMRISRMVAATVPMPLKLAETTLAFTWRLDGSTLTIDDYFKRQPVMALLIAKDGEIVYERYQHGRTAQQHYRSNSISKSVTGLALGLAKAEGKIPSFDALLQSYVPELKNTAYGETSLHNLMRMGSGVKYSEAFKPDDDSTKFVQATNNVGVVQASKLFNEREVPQGSRFNYASIEAALMAPLLKSATKESVASYLEPRLWQAMGAEGAAYWYLDKMGLEFTAGYLKALPRDYLRLGMVLANDGKRPDTGKQIIPLEFLLDSTDWHRVEEPFRPRKSSDGYSNFFWIQGSEARRFWLVGVHGQAIFVDPAKKLVMLHFAANGVANAWGTTMGKERAALWRGVVQHYGNW